MNWYYVLGAVLLPNFVGWLNLFLLSTIIDNKLGTLSPDLKKPRWAPPDWIVGPVWTILYTLMGIASYLVWRDGGGFKGGAEFPLYIYLVQLVLNWLYPVICFGASSLKWGLIDLIALTVAAGLCGSLFYTVNVTAGYLFIPYLMWLSFATILNYFIWRDNPMSKRKEIKLKF